MNIEQLVGRCFRLRKELAAASLGDFRFVKTLSATTDSPRFWANH